MKKLYLMTLAGLGVLALAGCAGKSNPCCDRMSDEYRPVVHFAFDSAALTSESQRVLQQAVEKIEKCPKLMINIAGYTDNTGTPVYNMKLGKERALAVQSYLMGQGISAHRFRIATMGENDPVACNGTEDGRAQNRRAVINFTR